MVVSGSPVHTTRTATSPLRRSLYNVLLGDSQGSAAISRDAFPSAAPHYPPSSPVQLQLVQLLEKLSLVDIANREGLRSLNYTISMADRLHSVNTDGVDPLVSILENSTLRLADDIPEPEDGAAERKDARLACASDTMEDFYVVPPGNIDYVPDENYYKKLTEPSTEEEQRGS